jgi:hypothetical protein
MAAQQNFQGMDAIAIRQPSVEEILMLAVEKSAGADAIERLVSLQQQLLAKEAETDFNESMNKIQTELRPIQTDAINPSTKSKYASYHQLDRAIRPVYTKYGFSLSFSTTDSPLADHVRVLCYVSRSGHTRTYQCDMPSDGKGAKGGDVMTKTHAAGSAMSYGMRYLLKMIFNIAVGEDDDDGNGGAETERVEWIKNASTKEELSTLYKSAVADAIANKHFNAIGVYQAARDAKLKEWQ